MIVLFWSCLLKIYFADLNLRTPFAQELEHGARMLREYVSSLLVDGWKLHDSLHQVTALGFLCICFGPRGLARPHFQLLGGKGRTSPMATAGDAV